MRKLKYYLYLTAEERRYIFNALLAYCNKLIAQDAVDSEKRKSMDNGASSYRRFLDGDDKGIDEIVGGYKDGLILYLNGYVNHIFIAGELAKDIFFRLITKSKSIFKSWLYAIGRWSRAVTPSASTTATMSGKG